MNKIQFDNLIKPLTKIYDGLELELIELIYERLNGYSSVSGSLEWYLEKLNDLGVIDKKMLKIMKKDKNKISKILNNIVEKASNNIEDLDLLTNYYKEGKIDINPNKLPKSIAINNIVREAIKDTDNILNLINTKAIEGAKESYKNILNKAYIETTSGIYTYQESIRKAINDMAKEGIKVVNYESGKRISIEAAVRRDIVTRVNKLVGDCEIEHAKQLGTNLMYVDQHLGARIRTKYTKHDYEAHAEWQGKKYMIEGSNEKYDNLYEKTGYGEMLGLKGINCYHNMRPTWEWEKIPNRYDEIDNALMNEKYQKQRETERKIRYLKRERLIAQKQDDVEQLENINKKINDVSKEYNKWLKDNNLTRDYSREYVV